MINTSVPGGGYVHNFQAQKKIIIIINNNNNNKIKKKKKKNGSSTVWCILDVHMVFSY